MKGIPKNKPSSNALHPVARRLILVRALRAMGQGMMVVALALYLNALGWSAAAIGGVLAAGGLVSIVFVSLVGIGSDRFGRKGFIILYELLIAGCALLAMVSTHFLLLFVAIGLSGFGKAQAGSAGPCAPAEQAWLAAYVPSLDRGRIYSINNAFGFFGMAAGAVFAGLTVLWDDLLPGAFAYRPLFGLILILSLTSMLLILTIREEKGQKQDDAVIQNKDREKDTLHKENMAIVKLASVNIMNGIAVGLTGPMMVYWFAAKFGVSQAQIGSTLAVTFCTTGVTSMLQARLVGKFGMIRSVVWVRLIASTLLFLIPLSPVFTLASVVYIARTALSRGTQGAQQALSVSLTRDKRRGFAASVNVLSKRVPSSVGPSITGYLFGLGSLSLPFFIAAGLQFGYAFLYGKAFHAYDIRVKANSSSG